MMIRSPILAALVLLSCSSESAGTDAAADASPDARIDSGAASDAAAKDADPLDADPIDADPIDAASLDAEPMDAESIDASADASVDAGRDCAAIEAEYAAIVARTNCQDVSECQVVNGHCASGLGGCWYTVNIVVMQADLDALATEYANLGCTSAVCRCTMPPASAICDNGTCTPP